MQHCPSIVVGQHEVRPSLAQPLELLHVAPGGVLHGAQRQLGSAALEGGSHLLGSEPVLLQPRGDVPPLQQKKRRKEGDGGIGEEQEEEEEEVQ